MHNIYVKDLLNICKSELIVGDENTLLDEFSIDTRIIKKGEIFVGIKGDSFDGGTRYIEALEKGAKGCIINNTINVDKNVLDKYKNIFIVLVDNTVSSLQELAKYKRNLYDIPVIGITGSVGKTSTKDMVASVLKEKYNVLATSGNYNNHIGVPLTMLRLRDENCAVIEMGMNNLNEISVLSKIAKPTVSIITNVGTAHIGNLGSRENILKAKLEILDGMDENGLLLINNDNDLLHDYYIKNKYKNIITYGINNKSNYMANNIEYNKDNSIFKVVLSNNSYEFVINTPGEAFVYNSLAGIAIGSIFNIDIDKIKMGIENYVLTKKRMEIDKIHNITLINDSYNANLDSMNNAIKYLGLLTGRKIAVLGDMLELGEYTEELHRKVADTIINNKIDIVITIGNYSKYIEDELNKNNYNNVFSFDNNNDAFNKLKEIIKDYDNILFKASNSMKLFDLCNDVKNYLTNK